MNDSALACSPSEGAPATMGQGRVVLRSVQDILIPGDEPVCSELAAGPLQALHDSQANGATRGGPAAWERWWAGPPDTFLFQHRCSPTTS